MASYISSYFGSNTNTQPNYGQYQPQYQQYQQTPSQSGGSGWTGAFSSRVGALRKALTRGSEEDDDDDEDASHVSNVLRAYYIEKGRPFPEWLPGDPTKPQVAPVQQAQYGQYGAFPGQPPQHSRGASQGRGGLNDLWDAGPSQVQQPPTQSLRAARPQGQIMRSFDSGNRLSAVESHQAQARPLPSQRAGSYNSQQPSPAPASNPRDRLRARLQGSNSGRSSPANVPQNSYDNDQQYGNGPSMSASQPWSNDSNLQRSNRDDGAYSGYGNTAYQQRSSGYR